MPGSTRARWFCYSFLVEGDKLVLLLHLFAGKMCLLLVQEVSHQYRSGTNTLIPSFILSFRDGSTRTSESTAQALPFLFHGHGESHAESFGSPAQCADCSTLCLERSIVIVALEPVMGVCCFDSRNLISRVAMGWRQELGCLPVV